MFAAILTLHILAAILLVMIVLLQSGRGAELGAAFGGMGQSTFGRSQSTFISKLTTGVAVLFMATSPYLAFLTTEQPSQSIIKTEPKASATQEMAEKEAVDAQAGAEKAAAGTKPEAAKTEPAPAAQPTPIAQPPLEQTKAPPKSNPRAQ